MKKSKGVAIIAIILACLIGLGYYTSTIMSATSTSQKKTDNKTEAEGIKLGLDLSGGVSITYRIKDKNPSKKDINDTVAKLEERAESYSTEYAVYPVGDDRITVEIPGVYDANAVLEDLGSPGSLYFIVQKDSDGNENYSYDSSTGEYKLNYDIQNLVDNGSVIMDGNDVKSANAAYNQTSSTSTKEPVVQLTLKKKAADVFGEATTKAASSGESIGIYYDDHFISVPKVESAIKDGSCVINGMSDYDEAEQLATFIRVGAINLKLEEMESSVAGAQLGGKALSSSVKAAIIGLILVMLFMILNYSLSGVVASIGLAIYTTVTVALIYLFEITLTLPGIAGVILGIGMAVDANVIIYARIREEIGAGVSVRNSIKSGFSKAFSAIFDGNITTLIAAFVLMWLGSGTVKGFAYTLALGIVISMFTALVVSRLIVNALYAVGVRDPKFYGSAKERKAVDFLGKKKVFFAISIILILCGPAAMFANSHAGNKALNYSLEFSGGTSTTVTFNEDMDIKTIDSEVTPVVEEVTGDKNVQPTKVVGTNQVVIKTRSLNQSEREALQSALVEKFGVDDSTISTESISSTVSSEMRRDAIVAVIVATICMLLYIWFRFKDIRFASSAVLALLHDVLVVLAFYAIARVSVGNTFIACMLTIVGYSINATIVIFDRIRENLHSGSREKLAEIVNTSITQTLTRSIYTSFTTFVMVAVLYIMGVSSIREFAAPLMVGVLVGAYSSVCITGALWYVMKKKFAGKGQPAIAAASASAKSASKPKKARDVSQKDPTQPKKKNRKRVAERLAAEEAAKKQQNDDAE